MEPRLAVKAFIVKDNKLLLIRRRPNDVHFPGEWDIPGGRLDINENPYTGMKREAMEEIGIDIEISVPMDIQHFTRQDGQMITMIIFLCAPKGDNIRLSEEHTEYMWEEIDTNLPRWLHRPVENYKKYYEGKV